MQLRIAPGTALQGEVVRLRAAALGSGSATV